MAQHPKPHHTPAPPPGPEPTFHEPGFGEDAQTADPAGFQTPHPSDNAVYNQIQDLLKQAVVGFPKSRLADDAVLPLAQVYGSRGPDVMHAITAAKRIVFHAVGDTGASDTRKYQTELKVSDQLAIDARAADAADRAAFLFHLGDVVYSFGEAKYYFDQFYDPYRAYPAPILALAGNHDSFLVPGTPAAAAPLAVFMRNFCAETPVVTPEAGGLHRSAMVQPGVYFALDAPFVRIIGLFSNALEDPGLISSQGGHWKVPDYQLDFLKAQLKKAKDEAYAGALVLAMHHPPFVYAPPPAGGHGGANHAGSSAMLAEIDAVCQAAGVYPHAVLSAHAHNYQRFTRTVRLAGGTRQVPFIVCGNGGHNVNPIARGARGQPAVEPQNGSDVGYLDQPARGAHTLSGGLRFEKFDDHEYGYLRITVDADALRIGYHQVGARSLLQSRFDLVTVDLRTHKLLPN